MGLFRVALPPSTPLDALSRLAAAFDAVLSPVVGAVVDVTVSHSYDVLARNLLSGAVDLAWAPPFVCARTEPDGARVLAQAIRGGRAAYASAFVVADDTLRVLADLRGRRAVFVDENSVAGYLLPLAHLVERIGDPARFFARIDFAGSYRAALARVDAGDADVAAVHAIPDDPHSAKRAVAVHLPTQKRAFHVVDVTATTPSEALVLSPIIDAERPALAEALVESLTSLGASEGGRALLTSLFFADRFARAERGAYRTLYRLAPRAR